MPRGIDLEDIKWHVVSTAPIANPCVKDNETGKREKDEDCLLYTSPSPRDRQKSRMPSSA